MNNEFKLRLAEAAGHRKVTLNRDEAWQINFLLDALLDFYDCVTHAKPWHNQTFVIDTQLEALRKMADKEEVTLPDSKPPRGKETEW